MINIGHTEKLAWSHTVSTAFRFTPYPARRSTRATRRATWSTGSRADGERRRDGRRSSSPTARSRRSPGRSTRPSTARSPTRLQGQALFAWTTSTAFALFDANADNTRLLNHYFDTNHAQSTKELLKILRKYQGIPWVNTIASDSKGKALYADIGSMPNVDNAKATDCSSAFGQVTFAQLGLPTLDGSRSECAPSDRRRTAAGAGPDGRPEQPFLMRTRLRRQRQRLLLAHQPRAAARGLPADHRQRAHAALAAHPARA